MWLILKWCLCHQYYDQKSTSFFKTRSIFVVLATLMTTSTNHAEGNMLHVDDIFLHSDHRGSLLFWSSLLSAVWPVSMLSVVDPTRSRRPETGSAAELFHIKLVHVNCSETTCGHYGHNKVIIQQVTCVTQSHIYM